MPLESAQNNVMDDAEAASLAKWALKESITIKRWVSSDHLRPLQDAMVAEFVEARIQKCFAGEGIQANWANFGGIGSHHSTDRDVLQMKTKTKIY